MPGRFWISHAGRAVRGDIAGKPIRAEAWRDSQLVRASLPATGSVNRRDFRWLLRAALEYVRDEGSAGFATSPKGPPALAVDRVLLGRRCARLA